MFEKLAAVIAEQKGIPASAIKEENTLEELGVDSLDAVDIFKSSWICGAASVRYRRS